MTARNPVWRNSLIRHALLGVKESIHGQSGMRLVIQNGTFAAVYTAIAFASLKLFATLNASASPVWPPTGLAIAALLLWGRRLWPGVYVGAFAANFLTTNTPASSLAIAAGNTLEALTCAYLVTRFAKRLNAFDTPRSLGIFVSVSLAATLVSATVGVTTLAVSGLAQWSLYISLLTTWWLGDASGALIVAPLIMSFLQPSRPTPTGKLAELGLLVLSTFVVGEIVFAPVVFSSISAVRLGFAVVPIIVWAGLRFGSRGATGATFLFSTIAVWGTLAGLGPYGTGNIAFLSLQFSMTLLATMGLAVGAVVHERLDAQEESRKAHEAERRFETLVESAPDAMVILDAQGRIIRVNTQTENLFGYNRQELLSLKAENLIPERFREKHATDFRATPGKQAMGIGTELYGLRKDGSEFPMEIRISPLQTDSGLLTSSSVRDITERRRVQEERARLAAIVESSSDAIIRESLDGTIVSWNRGAERMFGYTSFEAIGQKAGILMGLDENESEFLGRLKQEARIVPHITRLTRKDGRVIDVSLSTSPIQDPTGRTIAATIVVQENRGKKNQTLGAKTPD
jgi:PAS domain S-box-containing protein